MASAAIAVELTANRKVGPVSVTMASQASCPKSCPWLGSGCYAESGPQGFSTRRVNKSRKVDALAIAKDELRAIGKLSGERPLRLHVVGDASTTVAARTLSKGLESYRQPVWTYTHAWRRVARRAWGIVSVLASCESVSQVKAARARGYATALVVAEFPSDKAYMVEGLKVIPCPQQTGKTENCTTCRLCWSDSRPASVDFGLDPGGLEL